MKIYLDNAAEIAGHNELFEKGEVSFELGTNQFSDLVREYRTPRVIKPYVSRKNFLKFFY